MFTHSVSRGVAPLAHRTATRFYSTIFGDKCPLVITPAQLHNLKASSSDSDLVVVDASWHMPNSTRNAAKEYRALRIPSARGLDIDAVASSHPLGLSHMLPDPKVFAEACSNLGISPNTHVVFYDTHGVFSSPRALYMFRAFGHERSSVLDGGLPAWYAHGGQTESGDPPEVTPAQYPSSSLKQDVVKDYNQMSSNLQFDPAKDPKAFYVLDARSRGRFLGTDPEPRAGLSSGHMPHSISLPFNVFLETHEIPADLAAKVADKLPTTYTRLRPTRSILSALLETLGIDRAKEVLEDQRQVVTSCGSGMTAGVLWLGLKLLGVERVALYDESWTGYAMRPSSKIVKGE
ncbi:Rhodanese-like protein [Fomes fomentarius]|nr:Rhodanese-like protein [Fomes fomentarius]